MLLPLHSLVEAAFEYRNRCINKIYGQTLLPLPADPPQVLNDALRIRDRHSKDDGIKMSNIDTFAYITARREYDGGRSRFFELALLLF